MMPRKQMKWSGGKTRCWKIDWNSQANCPTFCPPSHCRWYIVIISSYTIRINHLVCYYDVFKKVSSLFFCKMQIVTHFPFPLRCQTREGSRERGSRIGFPSWIFFAEHQDEKYDSPVQLPAVFSVRMCKSVWIECTVQKPRMKFASQTIRQVCLT